MPSSAFITPMDSRVPGNGFFSKISKRLSYPTTSRHVHFDSHAQVLEFNGNSIIAPPLGSSHGLQEECPTRNTRRHSHAGTLSQSSQATKTASVSQARHQSYDHEALRSLARHEVHKHYDLRSREHDRQRRRSIPNLKHWNQPSRLDASQSPPTEWRKDYIVPHNACCKFPVCLLNIHAGIGFPSSAWLYLPKLFCNTNEGVVVSIPLDSLLGINTNLHWDLRVHYEKAYHREGYPLHPDAIRRQAILVHLERIRIIHPHFPWEVTVQRSHTNGIRIVDVLRALSDMFYVKLRSRDFHNRLVTPAHQFRIHNAARIRSGGTPTAHYRVDFLEDKFMFGGLEHVRDDIFRLRTSILQ